MKTTRLLPATLGVLLALGAMQAEAAKTLIYCSEGSPEGFDAARYTTGITFNAAANSTHNRLVEFERGSTRLVPGLAEKWTISPDGLSYTFSLRKGVKFHTTAYFKPSREFNADDVVFTFDRMIHKDNPFNKALKPEPTYPYASDTGLDTDLKAVEKVDAHTVRFVLAHPVATFLPTIAMSFAAIQSAEYANQLLKSGRVADFNNAPVGTGPFLFKRYDKDSQIRYAAFDQYWGGKPAIDNLIFSITVDSAVRTQKLKTNECQIAGQPKPEELDTLRHAANIKVMSQNGLNIGYIALNTRRKPLDNRDVRRALDMAVDKQTILKAIYQGGGTPAVNPIPPAMWSYNKQVRDAGYNPARARELLAHAGYPNGFETTLWALPVQRPYNPDGKKMAELIQADWARIGVKAKIVSYEWGEYKKRSRNGEGDAVSYGWIADFADPDNFLYTLLSCEAQEGGSNLAFWCNKDFNSDVTRARQTTNIAQRTRLYQDAQLIFKREVPWITIAHSVAYVPMNTHVQGFKISPLGDMVFNGVSLK